MVENKNNSQYTFSTGLYKGEPVKEYKKEDVPDFIISDELRAAVYKESKLQKIINKLKSIFKKNK